MYVHSESHMCAFIRTQSRNGTFLEGQGPEMGRDPVYRTYRRLNGHYADSWGMTRQPVSICMYVHSESHMCALTRMLSESVTFLEGWGPEIGWNPVYRPYLRLNGHYADSWGITRWRTSICMYVHSESHMCALKRMLSESVTFLEGWVKISHIGCCSLVNG